jgi:hypothetical protein
MKLNRGFLLLCLFGVLGVAVAAGQELVQEAIPNWSAPATWSPHSMGRGVSTMGAVTSPLPFIGLAPCRIVDTRGNGAPITGGMFTGGSDVRNYAVAGICGIPGSAQALSLNFTVVGPTAPGFLVSWPTGGAVPPVSILNFNAADVRNNAAVVPTNSSVSFTVNVSAPTHVIIDVNGYYAPAGVGTYNTFLGLNAGNFTMTGDFNTAFGSYALVNNTTGGDNTAIGPAALNANSSGFSNTAVGSNALLTNTQGRENTATGKFALFANRLGHENTATGVSALQDNDSGSDNTAFGWHALLANGSGGANGGANTAIGAGALANNSNATGGNTAIGYAALLSSTGSNNIAIGIGAGDNQGAGSHNIYIGNAGVNGESNTIRIGDVSFQDGGTIITGISGLSSIGGSPVYVNGGGRLGTSTSSSRRFKQDIRDIAEESDGLMRLRPVAFRYKPEFDPTGVIQYGLIAEEVAEVYPDLITSGRDGQPEGVRYHLITPLLLNEVQKQYRTLEAQEKTIDQQKVTIDAQQAEIEGLKARMSRLEARHIAESGP